MNESGGTDWHAPFQLFMKFCVLEDDAGYTKWIAFGIAVGLFRMATKRKAETLIGHGRGFLGRRMALNAPNDRCTRFYQCPPLSPELLVPWEMAITKLETSICLP
jgi:hypothetical protein